MKGATHNVVSDIAWSADARRLMFTAGECVVAVEVEVKELGGRALSAEEMAARLVRQDALPKKRVSMTLSPLSPTTNRAITTAPHTSQVTSQVTSQSMTHTTTQTTTHTSTQTAAHGKRAAEEEHEATATRKRKKPQSAQSAQSAPLADHPVVAPTISLPALSLTLPATLPLPSLHSTVSLQVLSTTTAPITPTTPDRLCATLVQATHTTGTPQWSWVGEGHVAAATLTARYFFACTREGILHVVTTDGRTAVPAVFVGEGPAAVASMEGKEGDRFAVVTVRGKMLVGVLNPGGRLTMENEIDLSRFVKEDVTGVRIHFVEYSVVKVQIQIKEKDWDDYMYDLNSRCWFVEKQNVFAYSYFNNATPAALNSPFATNSMLTVLAPSLSHA